MHRSIRVCALASLLALAAAAAWATVRPPVEVLLAGERRAAEAGKAFRGTLRITTGAEGELSSLRLQGKGWSARTLDKLPVALRLARRDSLLVRFEATPQDPGEPLVVEFEFQGQTVRKHLDLSRRAMERATTPGAVVRVAEGDTVPFPEAESPLRRPEPVPPEPAPVPEAQYRRQPGEAVSAVARTIRVRGRFVYQRQDGVTLGADGVAVRVYDESWPWDIELAVGITDAYGYYDVTFLWDPCFICDQQPDLYVRFVAQNSKVNLREGTSGSTYAWRTGTTVDYTGTDLNLGWLQPAAEGDHPGLHVLTDVVRTWRWLLNNEGYDTPGLDTFWPDGATGAWYNGSIHIGTDRQWREDTHAHEYGHHWIQNYAVNQTPDYCNGICDASATDCGHCIWCRETDHDAWNEGWPNWLADVITRSFQPTYGTAPMNFRSQESLATCFVDGTFHDPTITEGFLGALLRDIEDSGQDDHDGSDAWTDRLALGTDEIFDVSDLDHPLSPLDFIAKFRARYPWLKEQIWETARNCRYEVDAANPSAPTNLTSTSHSTVGDSPDPTIDYTWTRADDDWSGVDGYGIFISNGPAMPAAVRDIGDLTTYTTPVLAPGTYYFNIRTVDRSGKWSSTYASHGPITIRAPLPANLAYFLFAGWAHVLVPRPAADASFGSVPAPTSLPGEACSTWWNVGGWNSGESSTGVGFETRLYVDGVWHWWASWGPIGGGGGFFGANLGPLCIPGGRHTFEARLDATDQIAETNETDNPWARQWVWTPLALASGTPVTRSAPPSATAGWSSIVDGSPIQYNCDGLRFVSSGWWNAVSIRMLDASADYDCALHYPSAGAGEGFDDFLAYSLRGAGGLDGVIVNRNTVGYANWDVGVIHFGGSGNYVATHTQSEFHAFGDSVTVPLGEGEMVLLREFYIGPAEAGPVSIKVEVDPAQGPVYVHWLDNSFTVGDLHDYSAWAVTDGSGRARLDLNISAQGYHCVAVYRDQANGTGPMDVTIEIQRTPPDFLPYYATGWHSPLVPRPANDGTASSVPLPTVLYGDAASTYLNIAVRNASPTGTPSLLAYVYLDGVPSWWLYWDGFPGYADSPFNWGAAWTIRGGRHTLSNHVDVDLAYEEISEDNNIYGEQYVWSPLQVALGVPVARGAPPDVLGGWGDIRSGEPFWFNCDGLRTPAFAAAGNDGYWGALATMPGEASDVDLRLHEIQPGVKDGFTTSLGWSLWGTGHSDFVMANFNQTLFRAFDVGAVRYGTGMQSYTAEAASSVYRGADPYGLLGPFTMGANRMLDLHEFYLTPGYHLFRLDNVSGTVNWGMTLHPSGEAYPSKSTYVADGLAWLNGPGQTEQFTVSIGTAGYYGLAVWKVGAGDLSQTGSYRIWAETGAVEVPPAAGVAATALAGAYPNPVGARTAIAFDLAREQEVALEVFDLQGALVRSLLRAARPAGRHQVGWDATDEAGRRLPSGLYVVRLSAGGYRAAAKLVVMR